jgi:hypothetical protein
MLAFLGGVAIMLGRRSGVIFRGLSSPAMFIHAPSRECLGAARNDRQAEILQKDGVGPSVGVGAQDGPPFTIGPTDGDHAIDDLELVGSESSGGSARAFSPIVR